MSDSVQDAIDMKGIQGTLAHRTLQWCIVEPPQFFNMMHDFKSMSQFDAKTFYEGLMRQQQEGGAIQLMLPEYLQIVPTVLDALKILHHLFNAPVANITGETYRCHAPQGQAITLRTVDHIRSSPLL